MQKISFSPTTKATKKNYPLLNTNEKQYNKERIMYGLPVVAAPVVWYWEDIICLQKNTTKKLPKSVPFRWGALLSLGLCSALLGNFVGKNIKSDNEKAKNVATSLFEASLLLIPSKFFYLFLNLPNHQKTKLRLLLYPVMMSVATPQIYLTYFDKEKATKDEKIKTGIITTGLISGSFATLIAFIKNNIRAKDKIKLGLLATAVSGFSNFSYLFLSKHKKN